jgi:hypothetical protein
VKIPKIYYWLLSAGILLLILTELFKPVELDWRKTYSSYDKIPFGTSVMFELAEGIFPSYKINRINESFYNYNSSQETNESYIYICNYLFFDESSLDAMFDHVNYGNEVFISTDYFLGSILDSLGLSIKGSGFNFNKKLIENHKIGNITVQTDTSLNFIGFDEFYHFEIPDSLENIEILGTVNDRPNFIKVYFGDGFFLLHLKPELFTNYYILKEISTDYAENVLNELSDNPIIWDDYLINGSKKSSTPLRVILKSDGLRYAYYTALLLLLLFVLFAGRRKQKTIPVLEENRNKSIDFINTITNLYLGAKNHSYIAKHQINAFKLHNKNTYFLNWSKMDKEQINSLSKKSNSSVEEINKLKDLTRNIKDKKIVTQAELLNLTNSIQQFIKKKDGTG